MKKKGLFVAVLLLVAIVGTIALTGCSLVEKNEERQANRVIATVADTVEITNPLAVQMLNKIGVTDYCVSFDITRRELISNANYTINYYSQLYSNYGLTYSYDIESVLDDTLDSMISEKYYVIQGIEELLNSATQEHLDVMYMFVENDTYTQKYGHKLSAEGVLTLSEWYNAVGTVTESLQSSADSYIEDEQEDSRDIDISDADDKISEAYELGYFYNSIAIANKVEGEDGKVSYNDGLYQDSFIVSSDSDDTTKEVDYEKVYAKLTFTKSGAEDIVVYRPIAESSLTLADKEDADFIGKYLSTKEATITYTGRVYAEITEDNENGYTSEEKTSDKVSYTAVTARSKYTEAEEETKDYLKVNAYRFATKETWEAFKATYDATTKEYNKDTESWTNYVADYKTKNSSVDGIDDICDNLFDALSDLYGEIFVTVYDRYDTTAEKEGYRQLRKSLSSANIGYDENNLDSLYQGLRTYYVEQFASQVLSGVKYDLNATIDITDEQILDSYKTKVLQDKVKYDGLTYKAQLTEFFKDDSTAITDISGIYYLPMDALLNETFEIDPTDKSYAPLFEDDGTTVKASVADLITEDEGKYYMHYAYANTDGTYTINSFFVGHILFSFDNSKDIKNLITDSTTIDVYTIDDLPFEMMLTLYKTLVASLNTNAQVEGYAENGGEQLSDVFATDENGLVYESVSDVVAKINDAMEGKEYTEVLDAFLSYMKQYNDDSGAISNAGYLICSGDIDTGFMKDFADTGRQIYYSLIASGINPNDYTYGTDVDAEDLFAEAYTVYGMHYMYVTFAPYYHFEVMDIDGNYAIDCLTKLNLDGDTHAKEIYDSLYESASSDKYASWKKPFTDDVIKGATTKNDKNYDALVKDITED